jgi:outer membrane murein-binding lipoprotein Lpp
MLDVTRYLLLLAAVALAACSRNIQTKEAIERAVREYLNSKTAQTGLDMNAMTIEVTSMSFEKDQAQAGVYFKLKSGDGGMQMQYALDRKGDQWVVRGLTGVGSGPHAPGSTATAPGSAPKGDTPPLPPNHPKLDGPKQTAPELPAGHPAVGSTQGTKQ